jgi:hypothetical protein
LIPLLYWARAITVPVTSNATRAAALSHENCLKIVSRIMPPGIQLPAIQLILEYGIKCVAAM